MNAKTLTPNEAINLLRQLAGLEQLKLSLGEHAAVQQALDVLAKLAPDLKAGPQPDVAELAAK